MYFQRNLIASGAVLILVFILITNNVYSQGNSNGNANSNNNANGNALKWETQGNNADTSHFIGTTNPIALKMRTNNVERLKITKDGKFGIGISNPLEKFELQGSIKLTGDVVFSDYADANDTIGKFLMVDENGRTNPVTLEDLQKNLYAGPIGDQSLDYCAILGVQQNPIWSNGPNKIFSYCPDVFVGIGTNDPQKQLDVRGTTQTQLLQVGREYAPFSLMSGVRIGVTNASLLALGQYDPQSQNLHKALDFRSSGELKINYKELQNGSTGNILSINSESDNVLNLNEQGLLEINYLGQNSAFIVRSESQSRKILQLDNNGLLRARRIKIDADTWADFVFEEDYSLMPLADLKIYIDDKGHLPNVPSEKELAEEGLDLAQMNKLLMQKIEELTLYILEQNDKSEELEKKIEELQEQISKLK